MGRRLLTTLITILSLICGSPLAFAKDGDPVDRDDQKARQLFREGDKAYAEKRFEDAAKAFMQSYELSGRPLMLYNVANAFEQLGRWEDAANVLREYRRYAPKNELRTVDARIASLTARAEREKLQTLKEEQVWAEKSDEENKGINSVRGVALVSSGAATLLTGGVLAILAKLERNKIEEQCSELNGSRFCPASTNENFRRDRALSISADVAFAAGLAITGVGIYYLVRDNKKLKERQVSFGGAVGLRGASISLRGKF